MGHGEAGEGSVRSSARLGDFWFRPVAAIRPYLFQKCFCLLIATDAVVLMTERGARYGLDGFNVAHFRWLDAIHPLPTSTWYVGVLMLVAVLALLQVFARCSPWRGAALAALYTYGWTMSRYDSYLHHYLASLVLTAMVFFPRWTSVEILAAAGNVFGASDEGRSGQRHSAGRDTRRGRAKRTAIEPAYGISAGRLTAWTVGVWGLVLAYRIVPAWNTGWGGLFVFSALVALLAAWTWGTSSSLTGPLTSAPAFRMLGATVGIVYVYTSIAKMDAQWCAGYTLREVGAVPLVLGPLVDWLESWGLPRDWFWAMAATAVIPLELTIAASYLASLRQDEPTSWLAGWIARLGWALAIGLHLNNEMMGLTIQWFSYYMVFLACFMLLPAQVLWAAGAVLLWPAAWATEASRAAVASARGWRPWAWGLASTLALVAAGWYGSIPGVRWSLPLAALLVLVVAWRFARRQAPLESLTLLRGGLFAGLGLILLFAASTARFGYYQLQGRMRQKLVAATGWVDDLSAEQDPAREAMRRAQQQAIVALERALEFRAPNATDRAEVLINLGLAYRILGNLPKAAEHYRRAIETDPSSFLAYYNLGVCQQMDNQPDMALRSFQQALAIKPDMSDAMMNMGMIFELRGAWDDAIRCYEAALVVEPSAPDIHQRLEAARHGRATGAGEESGKKENEKRPLDGP